MSLRIKLLLIFSLGVLLLVFQANFTAYFTSQLQRSIDLIVTAVHAQQIVDKAKDHIRNIQIATNEMLYTENPKETADKLAAEVEQVLKYSSEIKFAVEKLDLPPSFMFNLTSSTEKVKSVYQWFQEQLENENQEGGVANQNLPRLLNFLNQTIHVLSITFHDIYVSLEASIDEAVAHERKIHYYPTIAAFVLCLIATVVMFLVGWYFSKSITLDIERLNQYLFAVSKGKLDAEPIKMERSDEIAELNRSLIYTTSQLKAIHDDLGAQVKARTEQLQVLNESLIIEKRIAEQASQSKSIFLSNMSHEIRTPLNAVLAYSQILERDKTLGAEQHKTMIAIQKAGNHLLTLINDILDLSKIEAGAMELDTKDFDFGVMLSEISYIFEGRCMDKQLNWILESNCPKECMVHGDDTKIRQAVINLVGNAVKFTDEGDIKLKVMKEDQQFHFEAIDTGPGIHLTNQKEIFEPFSQEESGHKKGGTGLGLAITKLHIEMMGGELMLDSKVGEGSRFFFTLSLPKAKSDVKQKINYDEMAGHLPKDKHVEVVVADAEEDNLDILNKILQDIGITVYRASNGLEALQQIEKHSNISLAFLDIRMPVMGGVETVEKIKSQYSDKIKCAAVSAFGMKHEVDKYLSSGFDYYIAKPYSFGQIFMGIEQLLEIKLEYSKIEHEFKQEQVETLAVEDLQKISIPSHLHKKLYKACKFKLLTDIRAAVPAIQAHSEDGKKLIATIQPLLDKFDLKAVVKILDEVKHE